MPYSSIITVSHAHDGKLSANQGNARGQRGYGFCFQDHPGIDIDLTMAGHYFKLSAGQRDFTGQFNSGFSQENGIGSGTNLIFARESNTHLPLSVTKGKLNSLFASSALSKNPIGNRGKLYYNYRRGQKQAGSVN
jgi:TPR repeat protein